MEQHNAIKKKLNDVSESYKKTQEDLCNIISLCEQDIKQEFLNNFRDHITKLVRLVEETPRIHESNIEISRYETISHKSSDLFRHDIQHTKKIEFGYMIYGEGYIGLKSIGMHDNLEREFKIRDENSSEFRSRNQHSNGDLMTALRNQNIMWDIENQDINKTEITVSKPEINFIHANKIKNIYSDFRKKLAENRETLKNRGLHSDKIEKLFSKIEEHLSIFHEMRFLEIAVKSKTFDDCISFNDSNYEQQDPKVFKVTIDDLFSKAAELRNPV